LFCLLLQFVLQQLFRVEMSIVHILAVACALLVCASATEPYFMMQEGETWCFLADVPADTQIVASYALLDLLDGQVNPHDQTTLKCWIDDPDGYTVMKGPEGKTSGYVTVRSGVSGEFRACVTTSASRWGGAGNVYKVALTVRDGVDTINYANLAKVEELNQLEVSLRRANDQVLHIRNEQEYQRAREARFRRLSESTSRRVFWLAFLQIGVFAGCTVFQLYSLRTFFKKNKLY